MPETGAQKTDGSGDPVAQLVNPTGASPLLFVCEHASCRIPDEFEGLGLSGDLRSSHIAWDPGALQVGCHLSALMDARLVASTVSRLVYDCNRPPDAPDAVPARSERFDVPGNVGLNDRQKAERARNFYEPFRNLLAEALLLQPKAMATVHSFTPVYLGKNRDVEIGILHGSDRRLADQMLRTAGEHTKLQVRRNEPYGEQDGVMHTLNVHAIGNGLLNVMLEIRNDLIASAQQQRDIAEMLAGWLMTALGALGVDVTCEVPACRA